VVAELSDVRDFLALCQPFALLPPETLDELPGRFVVRYLRRGTSFPPGGSNAEDFYLLRKGAVELRNEAGVLLAKLAEGDGYDAADNPLTQDPGLAGVTIEDCLVYVLPAGELSELRRANPLFNDSFEHSLRSRMQGAREAILVAPQVGGNLLRLQVSELLARAPVCAAANTSARDAAQRMTAERVSALMIVEGDRLIGIVTDRDLRSRGIAAGFDPALAIQQIMTPDPIVISPTASAFDALLKMTGKGVHHLPVVDRGAIHGLISTHDLIRVQSANPLYVADRIRRSESVASLSKACEQTRELHLQLMAAHATAAQLGHAITAVADAATRRLIEFGTGQLGAPPVPFAWIATGSQGRGELGVGSDQDNAMILDDAYEESLHGQYFEALARLVNQGLAACGYRLCPGDVMASNASWRQPLGRWRDYFRDWIDHSDHKKATLAANFFDMRTIHGDDSLRQSLMQDALPYAADDDVFLGYQTGHAVGSRPPLGFFRRFVLDQGGQHEGTVDLKTRGLIPIVDLARVCALRTGAASVGTNDRLRAVVEGGALSQEGSENLRVAFEFIGTLRALHQADCLRRNEPVDNRVAPARLAGLERRHLKDAFTAIATTQEALRAAYQGRLSL
jgi:CBS domain-containing protein